MMNSSARRTSTTLLRFLLAIVLLVTSAFAQFNQQKAHCTIRVDVLMSTGGHAGSRLYVRLLRGINGMMTATAYTNTLGTAEFADVDPGQYQVVVSGENIETASSGAIEVDDFNVFQSQTVVVSLSHKNETQGAPTVTSAELSVPPKAVKEYNRGNQEMSSKEWQKAIDRFSKAIEIFPGFCGAYNNMAVAYGQLAQAEQQRNTLRKVVGENSKCLPAFLNLTDLDLKDRNLVEARMLLEKVLKAEPSNIQALYFFAQLSLAEGQYDLAIITANKVHAMPHREFANVHFTAASAYEHESRRADAIAELKTFLLEAPNSPSAEAARKAINGLERASK